MIRQHQFEKVELVQIVQPETSMEALDDSFASRTRESIDAGCDVVLHCNGNMEEMVEIANNISVLCSHSDERILMYLRQFDLHVQP